MSSDLFAKYNERYAPLAHRLRPQRLEDFVGQSELIASVSSRPLHSMILYGPPGCGKTTLAGLLAARSQLPFHSLSAVSSGVKELREVIEEGRKRAQLAEGVLLFVDEIHRFSKSQQDALLHAVEAGWVFLIGATTENPSFEIIRPLLSRCQVYRLRPLGHAELLRIADRALAQDRALKSCTLSDNAKDLLIESAGGDARKLLLILESTAPAPGAENVVIAKEDIAKAVKESLRAYDRAGENHYDFASALIKSLRGSDPDAALLFMACMLEAGEDPLFIARRLIIFAAEDIGNAAPQALQIALVCFQAAERIGMPEARIVLGQAVTFLASSPKSNAAYKAMDAALEAVRGKQVVIPNHLRNAPTATHKAEGAGEGYLYPHDFPGHFSAQQYLPEGFEDAQFYFPTDMGQESKLRERLRQLRPGRNYD